MKQNIFLYFIIIILLIFNSVFIIQKKYSEKSNIIKETAIGNNNKLSTIINVMVENQNLQISSNLNIVDERFDTLRFSELINSNKLVFYFNEYSCMPCVEEIMQLLNSKVDNSLGNNIIILSHYNQLRDMYLFSHVNKLKIPIYNLTETLRIPLASKNIPFLFTINKNLKINNLFLVDKSLFKYTKSYISTIEKVINTE